MEDGNRDEEDRLVERAQHPNPQSLPDFNEQKSLLRPFSPFPDFDPSVAISEHLPYGDSNSIGAEAVPLHLQQQHSVALASYAANNTHAANANASLNGTVNPDDFYRTYSASVPTPITSSSIEYDELMASTSTISPAQRQNQNASSLRSNSNGTTPKHPAIPAASRAAPKPTSRSVSAPTTDGSSGAAKSRPAAYGTRPPSVKDLKKRFDQNAAAQASNSSSTVSARSTSATRAIPRDLTSTPSNYRGVGSANGPMSSLTARSQSAAGNLSATRSSQRSRFSAEDQVSNNSQSFASRIAKPRGDGGLSSKSMSNLSARSPTNASPIPPIPALNKSSTQAGGKGLLFGEILPGENDNGIAGHGIEGIRPRRTSESNLQSPSTLHHRSLSHTDVEPPSPTDWYRGTETGHDGGRSPTKLYQSHNRSHSDLAGTKPTSSQPRAPLPSRKQATATDYTPSSGTSKLPVSVSIRKSSPTSSASDPSSRSNTPSTFKRPSSRTHGKIPKPAPISTSSARAKTPTNGLAGKRPSGAITPNGNTRLNAYISAPPPKLSPPLRSSRPRQPVSTATTASSRMRATERGRSPVKGDPRTGKQKEPGRRRKVSIGPIDFNARREQIKLSYTKSIKEGEAKAAAAARRQAALEQERRRRADEDAASAAEAARLDAEKQREEEAKHVLEHDREHARSPISDAETPVADLVQRDRHPEQPILTLTPEDSKPLVPPESLEPGAVANATQVDLDSPTLGIPGSFPSLGSPNLHDAPLPSAASDTTEFDAEPQTEPPIHQAHETPTGDYHVDIEAARLTHPVSEYKSPFDQLSQEDDTASIKISLGPSPAESRTLAHSDNAALIEGATQPSHEEYVPQPFVAPTYETTVTIISRDSDFLSKATNDHPSSPSCDAQSAQAEDEEAHQDNSAQGQDSAAQLRSVQSDDDGFSDQDTPLKKLEEFYIGPNVADSAARLRGSGTSRGSVRHTRTWSMEQNEHTSTETPRFSTETRRTLETRPSLTVPRTVTSPNRNSQNTVWTDYSMESRDEYPEYSIKVHRRDSAYRESDSLSDAGSRFQRNSGLYPSSPETSPHGSFRAELADSTKQQPSVHRLPELDTGGGFVVDYITRKNSTAFGVPVLPDHSPPLPPDEGTFPDLSSAPPSEYFDDTRPSSYLHGNQDGYSAFSMSRPQSESYDLPGSGPQSIGNASLEISEGRASTRTRMDSQTTLAESIDQHENSTGLSAKERKRLFTRLETVKELVDTEAFFVRDMSIVEEIYKGTAEACPKLDDKIIKLIFRNTDQIIAFHTTFLSELKDGVSSIYVPKVSRSIVSKDTSSVTDSTSGSNPAMGQLDDGKDRETSLGPIFKRNIEKMKSVHETFLKNSDHAAKQLIQIQEDPTVKVWLNECNEVARDLTKAWNLDSLLIKPMQRITKYPNLLIQLLHETPLDHPDRPALESAKAALEDAIEEINKTKKNFELVGQIVGRKRKDSNVGGFARAFGKRVDKLQAASSKPVEDADYMKLHEKFGDDYLRLQVVLRDVEFYTRQVSAYVHEFLQYLSSMELVMRLQPSPHPELESKWVRFNVSMRDVEKVALEQHLAQVRKQVIEPFEAVIKAYSNPSLAMKKRTKRRADYEKSEQLKKAGKKIDKQLTECVEQYEALNDALKKELPKLSALTEKVGNICLGNLVNIQTQWYSIWKEKVKVVLDNPQIPEISDIVSTFQRDFKFQEEDISSLSILNPASGPRPSQSSVDETPSRLRPRPSELSSIRGRGLSVNSDVAPSLPTPDFIKRHSGQFTVSPSVTSIPSPHQFYYRDYYAGINTTTPGGAATPSSMDPAVSARPPASSSLRPSTGQSYDSNGARRQSTDSSIQTKRYSNSIYQSGYQSPPESAQNQRFSGLFNSALPMSDVAERSTRQSRASSRASSRERAPVNGYNVMWLAASLFEFNIETTKVEAGYPYLTYQAGEIFDVIAEKGELWLAKNQDDPNNLVGWLWSKHFAKLADD